MDAELELAVARALTAAKATLEEGKQLAQKPEFEQLLTLLIKKLLGRGDPKSPPPDPDDYLRR